MDKFFLYKGINQVCPEFGVLYPESGAFGEKPTQSRPNPEFGAVRPESGVFYFLNRPSAGVCFILDARTP
ncbi:MAG: hypothetical protein AAFR87_18145 [Bacteroidota bacterium]